MCRIELIQCYEILRFSDMMRQILSMFFIAHVTHCTFHVTEKITTLIFQ